MNDVEIQPEVEAGDEPDRDMLIAVTMADWSVLGADDVRLDVQPESTVLVGKNAAGKSILLESVHQGALAATFHESISVPGPKRRSFELGLGGQRVEYTYEWRLDSDERAPDIVWEESARYTESNREIWRIANDVARFPDGAKMPMPPGHGLLRLRDNPEFPVPPEVNRIRKLLRGISLVRAGVPRSDSVRMPLLLSKYSPEAREEAGKAWRGRDQRIIDGLRTLLDWYETDMELFECAVEICRRLEILSDINVDIKEEKAPSAKPNLPTHAATVDVDGVNFGYLSDGTLRAIEIVIRLMDPSTTVLLLEEPETAIHPGLLQRLLAEIEAHTAACQVIISTHSPLIVDWARPKGVRLVERIDGATRVRSLVAEELARITKYLDDELSLSDLLYSGLVE